MNRMLLGNWSRFANTFAVLCLVAILLVGCGGSGTGGHGNGHGGAGISVTVTPDNAKLSPGATQQFSANVTGTTNTAVTWSIVEAGGGGIDQSGLYTAPELAGTYQIQVALDAFPSTTATATVVVAGGGDAIGITISPISASLSPGTTQQFSANVTGTTNTAVTWSVVEAGGGSIDQSGLYTASEFAGTYQIQVALDAFPSTTATATVVVGGSGTIIVN